MELPRPLARLAARPPLVEHIGRLGQLVRSRDARKQYRGFATVRSTQRGGGSKCGVGGAGVQTAGVEAQPGVPPHDGAVKAAWVGASVDQA